MNALAFWGLSTKQNPWLRDGNPDQGMTIVSRIFIMQNIATSWTVWLALKAMINPNSRDEIYLYDTSSIRKLIRRFKTSCGYLPHDWSINMAKIGTVEQAVADCQYDTNVLTSEFLSTWRQIFKCHAVSRMIFMENRVKSRPCYHLKYV